MQRFDQSWTHFSHFLIMIPGSNPYNNYNLCLDTQVFQRTKSQIKKPKKHQAARINDSMPFQDLFPYINDVIHERWNKESNEKNDKLKEIKPDTRPRRENNSCRKNETLINRLRASQTLLTHGYLMEGLPMPQYELCLSLANDCEASLNWLRQHS